MRLERRLEETRANLNWAQQRLTTTLTTINTLTADGYPTSTQGGHSCGGISRPTEQAAIARAKLGEILLAITETIVLAQGATKQLCDLIQQVPHIGIDTARIAAASRCDGGTGEWANPTCERNATRTYHDLGDGRPHALCDACRQRWHRWYRKVDL